MVERQEVEALLEKMEARSESAVIETPIPAPTLAALCRAWLAVEEAEIYTVVDSSWRESGAIYDVSPDLVGQRVRIVKEVG